MRTRITLFLGIFSVMALSNAIVPVLPAFAADSAWSGAVYSAYFLGAFLSTLPAGILSDRYGRIRMMRIGLAVTVVSGLLLSITTTAVPALAVRLMEGIGAGLFVAPAMSLVNTGPDHERQSGYLMALLNGGLVLGLIGAGLLAAAFHEPVAGIFLFTVLSIIPAVFSFLIQEPQAPAAVAGGGVPAFLSLVREHRGIWYSSLVLVGITGVVTSLYPKFSGAAPDLLGLWIAGMSVATIVAVLIISRFRFDEILAIQISAILMVAGVMVSYFSPAGFLVLGFLAGIVMIAQMAFLSRVREQQGTAMGLFTTTSYLGMAVLPFIAGIIADGAGFFVAFCVTALAAVTVVVTVRK
ncbi:MAG: MFS transporter [Methanoregula sp.]|jgi:MFS family permease|uniref:MFS transporter n=1 Tax=Methanoregula sp. TaxID=2052170 RepID=UPI003C17DC3A